MKTYNSFVVRSWTLTGVEGAGRLVLDVQHLQTGDTARLVDLQEAVSWLADVCETSAPREEVKGE